MNIDILLYFVFTVPIIIVGVQMGKLTQAKYFRLWMLLAISFIVIGVIKENNSNDETRSLSYFGSQMLLIFLILQKITRNIYFKTFSREPEFGKFPKFKIDYIYTLVITCGTVILPFLIDTYIFHML